MHGRINKSGLESFFRISPRASHVSATNGAPPITFPVVSWSHWKNFFGCMLATAWAVCGNDTAPPLLSLDRLLQERLSPTIIYAKACAIRRTPSLARRAVLRGRDQKLRCLPTAAVALSAATARFNKLPPKAGTGSFLRIRIRRMGECRYLFLDRVRARRFTQSPCLGHCHEGCRDGVGNSKEQKGCNVHQPLKP